MDEHNDPKFTALFEIMGHVVEGDVDALCVVIRKNGEWIGYAAVPQTAENHVLKAAAEVVKLHRQKPDQSEN
jgi:hypothetical protein